VLVALLPSLRCCARCGAVLVAVLCSLGAALAGARAGDEPHGNVRSRCVCHLDV